mgnify:CR=1 FL=1
MYACIGIGQPGMAIFKMCTRICLGIKRTSFPALKEPITSIRNIWNQVSLQGDIDDKLILSLIDHSYEEVIKKFTRKLKKEYDEIP